MNLTKAKFLAGQAERGIWRSVSQLLMGMLNQDTNDGIVFSSQFKIGTYAGTGSTVDVSLGFVPDMVVALNYTDRDEVHISHVGSLGSTGTTVRIGNGGSTAATSLISGITSGIAALNNTTTGVRGFMAMANSSESGKTYAYLALRNRPTT